MSFGSDDAQTTSGLDLIAELDVGSPTRHVGRNRHCPRLASFGDHLCFCLVALGVQHLVFNFPNVQHPAEQFTDLHSRGSHQNRTSCIPHFDHVINHRIELLPLGLEDHVILVVPGNGTVGWNAHHVQLVNVPQLLSLGFGRTRHARKLVVHAEIVLERDRGVGLRGRFDSNPLLGLDGLVQTV